MNTDDWSDRAYLTEVQYRTDNNLRARQSIYDFQEPRINLPSVILDLADLSGDERVADIGCGGGHYLAELGRRDHRGALFGVDLSAGMLGSTRLKVPRAVLLNADAATLPLADHSIDCALAMHMLYHVQEPMKAIKELRRVTPIGGRILVVLNGPDHNKEMRDLIGSAICNLSGQEPVASVSPLQLAEGETLLRLNFERINRHDLISNLEVPAVAPIEAYVASMAVTLRMSDPRAFLSMIRELVAVEIEASGAFRITTQTGCLVCQ